MAPVMPVGTSRCLIVYLLKAEQGAIKVHIGGYHMHGCGL